MLTDARSLANDATVDADICIVGGGAAGITIAREFAGRRCRVVLVESGGLEVHDASQALNDGVAAGPAYEQFDVSRIRAFGGSTQVWGGWTCPLDAEDFEPRDWVPHSGWPFDRAHLDPFYARAHLLSGLGAYDYDPSRWGGSATPGPQSATDPLARELIFQIAPTRFGAAAAEVLHRAANVQVILQATVVDVSTSVDGCTAQAVRATTLQGNRFSIAARVVVLAAGGLENPRLLLTSRGRSSRGLGNEHDLVGRYFADHLHVPVGAVRARDVTTSAFFQVRRIGGTTVRGGLSLLPEVRRRERLLGSAVTLHNADDPHDVLSPARTRGGYRSLMMLIRGVRSGRAPAGAAAHLTRVVRNADEAVLLAARKLFKPKPKRFIIGIRAEQVPNAKSRVVLGDEVDRLGVRRGRLEWHLSDQDLDNIHASQRLLARAITDRDVELLSRDGPMGWSRQLTPGAHYIGTTRMHAEAAYGVVDEHCRVHGTSNVYVAGSSVFPTGGWAPPTLTVIALALRLADHVLMRLGG